MKNLTKITQRENNVIYIDISKVKSILINKEGEEKESIDLYWSRNESFELYLSIDEFVKQVEEQKEKKKKYYKKMAGKILSRHCDLLRIVDEMDTNQELQKALDRLGEQVNNFFESF